jgi:hypothetical protein
MSSSDLVAVVTPVALPLLFFWVLGVFYADSHPAWRTGHQSRSHLRKWLPRAQAQHLPGRSQPSPRPVPQSASPGGRPGTEAQAVQEPGRKPRHGHRSA